MSQDWKKWKTSEPLTILEPELPWEGGDFELRPSVRGEVEDSVRELRDPYLFEEDGQLYLLYTGGGEQAIGIAQLHIYNL